MGKYSPRSVFRDGNPMQSVPVTGDGHRCESDHREVLRSRLGVHTATLWSHSQVEERKEGTRQGQHPGVTCRLKMQARLGITLLHIVAQKTRHI